jgi:hypothetical protein
MLPSPPIAVRRPSPAPPETALVAARIQSLVAIV